MGFKELQKFNEAMLAKQVWRLLDNNDSLFHRFFKAKFFPNGSILDAKEGNSYFAWKSILKGRDVIKKGLQWRVSNGDSIHIFHDVWLPTPRPQNVISPYSILDYDAKVPVLIDHDKCCWLESVIDNSFLPHEASLIKAIPLSLDSCEDVLFWPRNSNGLYSVKSGYKLLSEYEMNDGPSSSDLSLTKKVWRGIWNLRIQNRVKSPLWRAGSEALPTRVNLRKRKFLTDDSCPHFNLDKETSFHALWSCSCLCPVWKVHFSWLTKLAVKCTSLLDVIQLSQDHNNLTELFAMIVA